MGGDYKWMSTDRPCAEATMTPPEEFQILLERIRAGDGDAARELVRQYEPEIRRMVRVRLTDARLRRVLDSMDIVQSVLGNFFARVAMGQFQFDQPEEVLHLLVKMARNKLNDQVRRQHARRRDLRREAGGADVLEAVADSVETPSRMAADRELVDAIRRQLTEDERYLAEQRALGRDWAEIAADIGGSPDALRMKLTRALDRVANELNL